jgi:hypothetical protein
VQARTPWKLRVSTRPDGGCGERDPETPARVIGFGRRRGASVRGDDGDAGLRRAAAVMRFGGEYAQGPDRSHVRRDRPGRVPRGSASRSSSPRVPQSAGCGNLGGGRSSCAAAMPRGMSSERSLRVANPRMAAVQRDREVVRGGNRRGGEKPRGRNEPGSPIPGNCGPASPTSSKGRETPGGEPRSARPGSAAQCEP